MASEPVDLSTSSALSCTESEWPSPDTGHESHGVGTTGETSDSVQSEATTSQTGPAHGIDTDIKALLELMNTRVVRKGDLR